MVPNSDPKKQIDIIRLRDFITLLEDTDSIETPGPSWLTRSGNDILRESKIFNSLIEEALGCGFLRDYKKPCKQDFEDWLIYKSKTVQAFLERGPIRTKTSDPKNT